jgi:hypothetical protein
MSKSTDGKRSGGQVSRPVRSGSSTPPPLSVRVERAGGRDKGQAGHSQRAGELAKHSC